MDKIVKLKKSDWEGFSRMVRLLRTIPEGLSSQVAKGKATQCVTILRTTISSAEIHSKVFKTKFGLPGLPQG